MTREEAIRLLDLNREYLKNTNNIGLKDDIEALDMAIKALEEKTGHWKVVSDGFGDSSYICECSECKDTVWVYKDADRKWNYCPNCGAKMAESEE